MGHVTAARAVEQAFKNKYPAVEVKNVDIVSFANRLYRKAFVEGYNMISAKKPELWGWLYSQFKKPSNQKLPSLISRLAIEKRFIPFVLEFKPDFIISTHPLPMVIISRSKEKKVVDIYSSIVMTDFGVHSFWVSQEVNYYFVANEVVSDGLEQLGVSSDKIIVLGIPIELKFAAELDKEQLCKKFGLNSKLPTVLIVGGQFDFVAMENIIEGVRKKHDDQVQFIVVAGRDKYLKADLDNSDLHSKPNIKVFGFVDNMHELMTVSDLIFTKAGGLTVSECMAKKLPMVINKVIPGQEEDNVDFLVSRGAAVKADNFNGIIEAVNDLIAYPDKLERMKKAAGEIGKPNSATALADFVYNKISKSS